MIHPIKCGLAVAILAILGLCVSFFACGVTDEDSRLISDDVCASIALRGQTLPEGCGGSGEGTKSFWEEVCVDRSIPGTPLPRMLPPTTKERLAESETVIRARLKSASQEVSSSPPYGSDDYFAGTIMFNIEILEYLKGSDWGSEIVGRVYVASYCKFRSDRGRAIALTALRLEIEARWKDRQAILFPVLVEDLSEPQAYALGYLEFTFVFSDRLDLSNPIVDWDQDWMPQAEWKMAPSSGELPFLDIPANKSVRLSELREIAKTVAAEERKLGRKCVEEKYWWERFMRSRSQIYGLETWQPELESCSE